ncbi:hypothetical protein F2Q68_00019698 [Brassica cretica]|uniref:Uncharacterized protein n=1 Tax=Brassica cretica TaxID=69181 RepID=A0A8S9FV72_BRACR|nr:hypothetical protein F2Q68_00019698 [Brassica cretica]KAF3505438.1 hypothetical protein F2Q69_00041100 [Brassica cretica]
MISPSRRRHQPESLSVESSLSLSLVDDSASPALSSTIPPPCRSPRRFPFLVALLDDSAYLSLSTMAHLDQESVHLSRRPVAILDEIKPKEKAKFFSFYV